MLKTNVKASQITNLTDARYFAAWEVKWLGFNFDRGTEGYISPQNIQAIKAWVEGVQLVGEFSFSTADEINSAVELLGLHAAQVGMFTELEILKKLNDFPIIKEMVISSEMNQMFLEEHFEKYTTHVNSWLLNFDKNNISWASLKDDSSHLTLKWLKKIAEKYPIILSINFTEDVLSEVLEISDLKGINVVGGEEEKVGYKSFDELDEIFEALEVLV